MDLKLPSNIIMKEAHIFDSTEQFLLNSCATLQIKGYGDYITLETLKKYKYANEVYNSF